MESDWYKPLQKYEDDLTVRDVYYAMSDEKKHVVKRFVTHLVNCTKPNCTEIDELYDTWKTFTENERLTTYYILNEAVLKGKEIFNTLKVWMTFSEYN